MSRNNQNNIKSKRKSRSRSTPFAFLFVVVDQIAKYLRRGILGFIFADLYYKINEKWKSGFIYRFLRRENKKAHTYSSIVRLYEQSYSSSKIAQMSQKIIHSRLKIWGAGMFFFAFSTGVVSVVKQAVLKENELINFIVAAVILFISLPLMFSKRELGEGLLTRKFTRFIITNVLNLNASNFEKGEDKHYDGSYFIVIFISLIVGLTTLVINTFVLINIAVLLLTLVLIMSFPEIGILMLLAVIPFATVLPHPTTFVFALVIFTILGFISKFIRGKRILKFEFIDVLMLAIGILLLFGGIFTFGGADSFRVSEIYLAFLFMYFLIVNMYIRKPGIYRGLKVTVITGFLVAIVGIVYLVIDYKIVDFAWLRSGIAVSILERVQAMIVDKQVLGIYLVLIYPIAIAQMLVTKSKFIKCFYLVSIATILSCIIITLERTACIGIIVATLVFMIMYNFRSIWLALCATLASWIALFTLPSEIVEPVKALFTLSETEIAYRRELRSGVLRLAYDNLFSGIGVGESAFRTAYYEYASAETLTAANAGSLFLNIFVELGIVGLLVFVIIIFMFTQKCFGNIKRKNKTSRSRTMICAGYASIVSGCVMGINEYVWSNYRVFLTFWIVIALTMAVTKVNEKEQESERITNNMISVDIEID